MLVRRKKCSGWHEPFVVLGYKPAVTRGVPGVTIEDWEGIPCDLGSSPFVSEGLSKEPLLSPFCSVPCAQD